MSDVKDRAKIAAKEMKLTGWDRWAATVKDLLAELERMENSREAERMECEKLACTEIVDHIKAHFKLQEAPK